MLLTYPIILDILQVMKRHIVSSTLLGTLFLLVASQAHAAGSLSGGYGSVSGYGAVSCQPTYGGGTSCKEGSLKINKTVQHPKNTTYVENLGINDPKYVPEQTVNFQITVTNTGNTTIKGAKIKDVFPQYVNYRSGAGAYDKTKNILAFNIPDLEAGKSQTYTVSGTIATQASLPANQGITCVTNTASATTPSMHVLDTAELCIEKQVQVSTKGGIIPTKGGLTVYSAPAPKKTPATGPEMAYLFAAVPAGILGHFLRKKATA